MQQQGSSKGFFPLSRYRFWSTIALLGICCLAMNPWTYDALVAGTALINWLMVGIMFLSLLILAVDLVITRHQGSTGSMADARFKEGVRRD